jgi:hypothetical protein
MKIPLERLSDNLAAHPATVIARECNDRSNLLKLPGVREIATALRASQ